MSPQVLVTAFEPFGGLATNPSQAIVDGLPRTVEGAIVRTETLPVRTERIRGELTRILPGADIVIHTGVALDRSRITLERLALNLLDFDRPDESGETRRNVAIIPGAPFALPSRLPVRAILKAWHTAQIPAAPSLSAGTFICNQTMYLSLQLTPKRLMTGFVHVAPDEVTGGATGLAWQSAAVQTKALEAAIQTCVRLWTST